MGKSLKKTSSKKPKLLGVGDHEAQMDPKTFSGLPEGALLTGSFT
jgi:hypothetical protein